MFLSNVSFVISYLSQQTVTKKTAFQKAEMVVLQTMKIVVLMYQPPEEVVLFLHLYHLSAAEEMVGMALGISLLQKAIMIDLLMLLS